LHEAGQKTRDRGDRMGEGLSIEDGVFQGLEQQGCSLICVFGKCLICRDSENGYCVLDLVTMNWASISGLFLRRWMLLEEVLEYC
jgi:hypothetical protein